MTKSDMLSVLKKRKLIAVVRADSTNEAEFISDALAEAGINTIEITMTVPGALDIISSLAKKYSNSDIVIGAGTVLDESTARLAILNGASFVVGPNLNREMIKCCNRYNVLSVPGVMTVNEAVSAMELGVELVKLFPASVFKPSVVKDIKGPLPQLSIMPTGGVNLENLCEWLDSGADVVGVGSDLYKNHGFKKEKIINKADKYVKLL